MEFPDDVGPKMLMNRSVLAHSCYEVWASGPSLDKLHEDFKRNVQLALPYSDKTFQIRVETFGKSIRHSEKLQLIQVPVLYSS
jgi:tRNA G10  N-methylase Trm11